MKRFLVVMCMLFLGVCYADEITHFLGIPFGSDKDTVVKEMTSKGWKYYPEDDYVIDFEDGRNSEISIHFDGNKYAGLKVKSIYITIRNKEMCSCAIRFMESYNIDIVVESFVKKYKLDEYELSSFGNNVSHYKSKSNNSNLIYNWDRDIISISNKRYGKEIKPAKPSQKEIDSDI